MGSLLIKIISSVLSVSMELTAWCCSFPGTASEYCGEWYGDVNANNIVDAGDASLVLGYLLRITSFSDEQVKRADADRNGKITIDDVGRIIGTAYNRYGLIRFDKTTDPGDGDDGDETQFVLGEYDLVVSPDGNDLWSGRLAEPDNAGSDGPLQTLYKAKSILAAQKDHLPDNVTVWLRGGMYVQNEELNFTEDDASGVIFRAYPKEKPEITASGTVSNWSTAYVNGHIAWKTYVGFTEINTLYHGIDMLSRSRYPKTGYFNVDSVSESDAIDPTSWNNQCHNAFYAKTDELNNFYRIKDVDVRILHLWKDELIPLEGYDTATGRVSLSKFTTMTVRTGDRYYFENVFEALSEQGEWYYDKPNGIVYYMPYESDSINSTVLRYGTLETILTMDGCKDISFSGITFRDTKWSLKSNSSVTMTGADGKVYTGLASPQAASDVSSAIKIINSENIAFKRCSFTNIGMSAVKFCENTHNCSADRCNFYNIGASAVTIYGENIPDNSLRVVHNIDITNCHIEKYGRVFNYATGILLIHANHCELSNNEICDGYYSGISAGWSWGYGYSVTHDLSICNNIIYNIGQGALSDMGGIYTLGIQKGTVIRGNIIHDVNCYDETEFGYGGWGLHLDEGTSYVTVENNLIYCCSSQGLHINYGEEILVKNNIFALNGDGQVVVDRKEDHSSMYFTHNIVVSRYEAIYNRVKTDVFKDNENLYWDYCRKANIFSSGMEKYYISEVLLYPIMKIEGYYCNAVVKDPLFEDINKLIFNVCPNSPALDMGFTPWDYSIAGIHYKSN